MPTKADIAKIKPRWDGKVAMCCCKILGGPPFASPDGCDFFHEESVPREPTEQSCQFPGLEMKCRSIKHCIPGLSHLSRLKAPRSIRRADILIPSLST